MSLHYWKKIYRQLILVSNVIIFVYFFGLKIEICSMEKLNYGKCVYSFAELLA